MQFTISDMPFGDDTHQEEIERRRADSIARKQAKAKTRRSRRCITKAMHREEKKPMSDTHTAKKPNETSAAPTTEQKYKTACGNRIVMRKLPSDDGTSLIDAIRGESRLADQVVARYPDETQVRAWIEEHFKAHEAVPYKHQMCLKPFMGGIFAFPVGLSDQCLASALSDADDQKAMAAYMNHCRSTYLGVCKVSGDVQDFVAVEVPSVATQIEWTIEHYKTVGSPKPGEVKIVEWQHGLYPFAIGDFFTNTVLPQVYNVPDADAVAVAEALAA